MKKIFVLAVSILLLGSVSFAQQAGVADQSAAGKDKAVESRKDDADKAAVQQAVKESPKPKAVKSAKTVQKKTKTEKKVSAK